MSQICKCFYKHASKSPDKLTNCYFEFFSKALSDCFKFFIVTIYMLITFFWYCKDDNQITQPNSSSTLSTSAHSRFPQHSKSCQSSHFPFSPCLHANVSLQTKINLQYSGLNAAFFTNVKPIWQ